MKINGSILDTIGRTPIVKINRFPLGQERKNIYAKLDFFNLNHYISIDGDPDYAELVESVKGALM